MPRLVFLIMVTMLILTACGNADKASDRFEKYDSIIDNAKPIAFGEDELIYVFCDDKNWETLEELMLSVIERDIFLVYNEKYFQLERVSIKDVEQYTKYKNLMFIGDLESRGKVSEYMKTSLDPTYLERVKQSGGDLFVSKNHWVRDQLVLYLLATDADKLPQISALQSNQIFSLLLKRYTERLALHAYLTKIIPDTFFADFPFSLKLPETYRLFSNDKQGRFLSFLYRAKMQNTEIPDKYISVYYEDMDSNMVDAEWLIARRQDLATKYFDGDIIDAKDLRIEKYRFAGHEGWRIIGPWKNLKLMIGGSFQAHGFWDEKTKRAYIVDNSVYFPAGNKLPSMLELFMISSTLSIK